MTKELSVNHSDKHIPWLAFWGGCLLRESVMYRRQDHMRISPWLLAAKPDC